MEKKFEVEFLPDAVKFMNELDKTYYNQTYYRLFAFWDKSDGKNTLVLATNGLKKKTGKTPKSDLERAERIRKQYFEQK
jgi:phage-related protein